WKRWTAALPRSAAPCSKTPTRACCWSGCAKPIPAGSPCRAARSTLEESTMRTLLIRSTLALACLAAFPALAGTPIDQTRPMDPRGRSEIENLKGRVEVRAWDRQEVKVTGTLGDGVEKFSLEGDRRNL